MLRQDHFHLSLHSSLYRIAPWAKIRNGGRHDGTRPLPPKPHRERSVHKGPDTQSAPCAQTRCTLPSGSHRTAFCGQPRANEQEVGSSFYGPVGPGWVERIGKGYHLDITARGADTISGCRSLRLLAAGLVEVQHPKLMRLIDPRGCQGAGE
jgi:hypothetical protein